MNINDLITAAVIIWLGSVFALAVAGEHVLKSVIVGASIPLIIAAFWVITVAVLA